MTVTTTKTKTVILILMLMIIDGNGNANSDGSGNGNCNARAVFNRESKVNCFCFGLELLRSVTDQQKLAASFSKQNQNQSRIARAHFPALCVHCMHLLRILIVSLHCFGLL